MHYRNFGGSDATVSEVGLGCWQLGGSDWGDVDDGTAFALLDAATASGTTFFDTADVYGAGRSEELLGRYFAGREMPFIATKLGRWSEPGGQGNCTRESIRKHAEASLRRLHTDALDLEQLHCVPTDELRRGDVFEHLRELQREGKIKRVGASVESDEEALICLHQEGLASLQIIFNIFRQKPATEIFEKAKQQGVAIIVRLPLASGLLSGKMTPQTRFAETDHRNYNRDGRFFNVGETFAGLPFEIGATLSQELNGLVPTGYTMTQMALRWCLDFDAVTTIIPGAKNPQYAAANAAASDLPPLTDILHAQLRAFYETKVTQHIRGPY